VIASIVVGVLAIVALVWRALELRSRLAQQQLEQDRARADRELALKEREVRIAERRAPTLTPPDPSAFPKDLFAMANGESEEWAREDMQALISEGYLEAGGDWQRANQYVGARIASQRSSRLPKHLLS
jgi:hypothetical protein